jgi:hypothetical protein
MRLSWEKYEGEYTMIEHENAALERLLEQPGSLHALREQVTLIKGWTQLVTRYSTREGPTQQEGIRKGLTRIDTASCRLADLLTQVLPPS